MVTQRIELIEIALTDLNQLRYSLPENIKELQGKKVTRIDFFDQFNNCFCVNGNNPIGFPASYSVYLTMVDNTGKKIINRLSLQTLHSFYNGNNRYNFSIIPDYSKCFIEIAPGAPFAVNQTVVLAIFFEETAMQIDWKKRLKVHTAILNTNDIEENRLYFKNNFFLNNKKIRGIMLLDESLSINGKGAAQQFYPIVLTKLVGGIEQQVINKYNIYGLKDQYQNDKNEVILDDVVLSWDKSYLLITDNNYFADQEYTFNIYYTD